MCSTRLGIVELRGAPLPFKNVVVQAYRFIERLVSPGMGFGSFNRARRTLRGLEVLNMICKGQIQGVEGDILGQVEFVLKIFGVTA